MSYAYKWIQVIHNTPEGVPAGICGLVFWTGKCRAKRGTRLGIDLNGEDGSARATVFVSSDDVIKVDPTAPLTRYCSGCEDCGGEGGHPVERITLKELNGEPAIWSAASCAQFRQGEKVWVRGARTDRRIWVSSTEDGREGCYADISDIKVLS